MEAVDHFGAHRLPGQQRRAEVEADHLSEVREVLDPDGSIESEAFTDLLHFSGRRILVDKGLLRSAWKCADPCEHEN
jgi:hypothetical protein